MRQYDPHLLYWIMAQKVYQSSEICGAHKSEKYAKQYYQSVIYIIQDRNDHRQFTSASNNVSDWFTHEAVLNA